MVVMMKPFQIEKNSEKKTSMIQKGKEKKVQDERLNVLLRDNTPKTQKYSLGYQRQHPKVQKTLTRVLKRPKPKNTKILTRVAKTALKSDKKHSPGQ
jgi:hypothetical protein